MQIAVKKAPKMYLPTYPINKAKNTTKVMCFASPSLRPF